MITADKFMKIYGGEMFWGVNPEKEMDRTERIWTSHHNFNLLDSIRASESEVDRLMSPLYEMDDKGIDLLESPSLPEFELVVREPIPSVNMTAIRFKKTAMPKTVQKVIKDSTTGCSIVNVPLIDAYISFQSYERVDCVMTIYASRGFEADGRVMFTATAQELMYVMADSPFRSLLMNYADNDFIEVVRDIKLIYLAVQRSLKHRPQVFYEAGDRKVTAAPSHNNKRKTRGIARVVKVIRLNTDELIRSNPTGRHMTCPCWGVMGHMRTYKSGKSVWIEPYRKGKERNNPNAYVAKEYQFKEEV